MKFSAKNYKKTNCYLFLLLVLSFTLNTVSSQTASFTAPDTVCVNTPVTFTNTSVGTTTSFWNFCVANNNTIPTGNNLGTLGGNLSRPVYVDYVFENGNYYGFVVSNAPEKLARLDFGNSLLNTPVTTNLGNVGGIIPTNAEGLQVIKNESKWYVIVVGGDPITGASSVIVKIDLGVNIANDFPTGVNWGNIGSLSYPHDLYVFDDDNGNWYGLTLNYSDNTITRFNFSKSFSNTPTATNLGNIGTMSGPVGLHAVKDNNNWYAFVTNAINSTLTRIDFGTSLLSTPTAVNLGNPGGNFNYCWDISILKLCGVTSAFVINARGNYDIIKLDFAGDIKNVPTSTVLGNIGNLSFPHCLSKIFRVGSDLYSLLPNVNDNTLTRLQFTGCTNSSNPNSNLFNPPHITYSAPGTYNINLTIDDGLPTQSAYCKQVVVLPKPSVDFGFIQDVCNPKSIQFNNESKSATMYNWSFGDGTFSSAINPLVYYTNFNNYIVKLKTTSGCTDSITKQVSVQIIIDNNVVTNSDTIICKNSGVQLNTLSALSYCWSPVTGLSNAKIANPIATPLITTTYYLNSQNASTNNLVVNGDFSAGNTGFTSSYNYATPNITEGQYYVGTNPNAWNPGTTACKDHTSGSGNMLLVNGASIADVNIWQQTITVLPNTNYAFSAWLQAIYQVNPAQLQFSINGKTIGNLFTAVLPTCNWQQFYTTWNSGTNTTATISIVNKNTIVLGNDFALDDISFAELSTKRDSVTITVVDLPVVVASADTTVCQNTKVQLKATGTNFYSWNQSGLLSDTTIANPIAKPTTSTNFIVKGYNTFGCFSSDTVTINVLPQPTLSLTKDTDICKGTSIVLQANSNANKYNWSANPTLSSENIYNPTASPNNTSKYIVTVTANNNCTIKDSVTVFVLPLPTLQSIADTSICSNATITLKTNSNGSSFSWLPTSGLSNTTISSPVASINSLTKYIVTATSSMGCIIKDTVTIDILPIPTIIKSANALICIGFSNNLVVNASNAVTYTWLPSVGLNNPSIANPVALPKMSTNYHVTVSGFNGCQQTDSIFITVKPFPVFSITPLSASVCLNDSVAIIASGGDTYQWISTSNINNPNTAKNFVHPVKNTIYQIVIKDTLCAVTETLYTSIVVNDLPIVTLSKSNDAGCVIGTVKLTASGASKYRWYPTETLVNAITATPTATPVQTSFYHVKAYSAYGCIREDSIEVKVIKGLVEDGYLVPNAFTPNGDGINDCFGVKQWGYLLNLQMTIYNRFGETIFSSNNSNNCWDGKVKGVTQPTGTYVYQISATTICGNVYRKGTLVLVR